MGSVLGLVSRIDLSQQSHLYVVEKTKSGNGSTWFDLAADDKPGDKDMTVRRLFFSDLMSEINKEVEAVEASLETAKLADRIRQAINAANKNLTSDRAGELLGKELINIVECEHDPLQATVRILPAMSKRAVDKQLVGVWQRFKRWICLWWYGSEKRVAALTEKVASLQEPIKSAQAAARAEAKQQLECMARKMLTAYKACAGETSDVWTWATWDQETRAEFENKFDTTTAAGKKAFEAAEQHKQRALTYAHAFDWLDDKYGWDDKFIGRAKK